MSDKEKSLKELEDVDINELLDSALEDFDKEPKLKTQKEGDKSEEKKNNGTPSTSSTETKDDVFDEEWSQEFIKQTAEQFEKNLQNLMQNGGEGLDAFQKIAQSVTGTFANDTENADFQAAIAQTLKDFSNVSENLQNGPQISEEDLANMFNQTSLDDATNEFLPMMQNMLQTLLSKEVLYPSLKEIAEKYPAWLEEKKSSLSTTDFDRFGKQLDIMQKVCVEMENEKEDDSIATKKQRFGKTLSLMQEMQLYGQPPEELIGELPNIFQSDVEGNSLAPAFPPGFDASQGCSLM